MQVGCQKNPNLLYFRKIVIYYTFSLFENKNIQYESLVYLHSHEIQNLFIKHMPIHPSTIKARDDEHDEHELEEHFSEIWIILKL